MNIIIVGGGTPNKFGNDFVLKARSQGHRVFVLSHKHYNTKDSAVANFSSLEKTLDSFHELTKDINHIDLFLYNTNPNGWPNQEQHYHSTSQVNESLYLFGFRIHVIIPHALILTAMNKMSEDSKIVFMTTDMIFQKEREKYTERLGYAGGKAYQHQLMLALAANNDKQITVSSVSPFFDYNNKEHYDKIFSKVYDHILTHGKDFNSKTFDCWD